MARPPFNLPRPLAELRSGWIEPLENDDPLRSNPLADILAGPRRGRFPNGLGFAEELPRPDAFAPIHEALGIDPRDRFIPRPPAHGGLGGMQPPHRGRFPDGVGPGVLPEGDAPAAALRAAPGVNAHAEFVDGMNREFAESNAAEADAAIARNRQPGAELGRGSTRYQNADALGYMKGAGGATQEVPLGDRLVTLPDKWLKPGEPPGTKVPAREYHARQKQHLVPLAQQDRNVPNSPTQKAMAEANFREAVSRLQSRAAQLAQSVRQRRLTPEQAGARFMQESVKFENSLQGFGDPKRVLEYRDKVLKPYMGAFGMQERGAAPAGGAAGAVAAPAPGAPKQKPGAMVDPKVKPAGDEAAADAPAAVDPKVPAAVPQQPVAAQGGSGDALAGYLGWLNYLARTQRDPSQYALAGPGANVPFGGMHDLQGVQGQAIDAFGDFLDRQARRNAGLFAGSLMGYPDQIQGQMALGARTLAGNQQASVDLKKAQAQAAAAMDVGRSNAFGQAFGGLGQAFAELAKRQSLNPILGLLAGLLGGGAFGGADGGMLNRKLPIGVNLGFPHYAPATVSHGSGVGRII